jgi:hypothetical protein
MQFLLQTVQAAGFTSLGSRRGCFPFPESLPEFMAPVSLFASSFQLTDIK